MDDRLITNELHHGSTQSLLACKSCRRKKLKCDRIIPSCRNCDKNNRTCDYPRVAQKPGPRPGTHRRAAGANSTRKRSSITLVDQALSLGTPDGSDVGSSLTMLIDYSHAKGLSTDQSLWASSNCTQALVDASLTGNGSAFGQACQLMQVSEQACLIFIRSYLENMTSFSLFHQPTFQAKISTMRNLKHMQTLLTTMLAFSIRFMDTDILPQHLRLQPVDILDIAYRLEQDCLIECEDDGPPLYLLQILILQAHMSSVFGVRGRSWRMVGQAVRIGYELRLHELDLDAQDKANLGHTTPPTKQQSWILVEEERRAWWAIWECDVFASTIQRLPNAIDWTRNRTNLPSSDKDWFDGNPQPSCHLNVDPNRRWRDLRECGNTNPTAWFILLNSYKWESLSATQRIAPPSTFFDREDLLKHHSTPDRSYKAILARKRETIENCVRCTMASLPDALQANDILPFQSQRTSPYPSLPLSHDHGIYMIQLMSEVTQLLISRKDLEGGNFVAYPADFTPGSTSTNDDDNDTNNPGHHFRVPSTGNTSRARWRRVLHSAARMASIIRSASPHHYKHVNPNAATALWMGAATSLASIAYHRDEIDVELVQSNLDLMTTTIERFSAFWGLPETLLRSLGTLEVQLRALAGVAASGKGVEDLRGNEVENHHGVVGADGAGIRLTHGQAVPDIPELTDGDSTLDLSPFDVLQAMDFGAMYNGVENWENLFLDPGFQTMDFGC